MKVHGFLNRTEGLLIKNRKPSPYALIDKPESHDVKRPKLFDHNIIGHPLTHSISVALLAAMNIDAQLLLAIIEKPDAVILKFYPDDTSPFHVNIHESLMTVTSSPSWKKRSTIS